MDDKRSDEQPSQHMGEPDEVYRKRVQQWLGVQKERDLLLHGNHFQDVNTGERIDPTSVKSDPSGDRPDIYIQAIDHITVHLAIAREVKGTIARAGAVNVVIRDLDAVHKHLIGQQAKAPEDERLRIDLTEAQRINIRSIAAGNNRFMIRHPMHEAMLEFERMGLVNGLPVLRKNGLYKWRLTHDGVNVLRLMNESEA